MRNPLVQFVTAAPKLCEVFLLVQKPIFVLPWFTVNPKIVKKKKKKKLLEKLRMIKKK